MTERRRRGRPPVLLPIDRRQQILAAAEAVFAAKGYAAASMNDVVRACGMSKKTVYRFFDTKERLFNDLVATAIDNAPELACEDEPGQDGEAVLRHLLRGMARVMLGPRHLALSRLVLAESPKAPELGAIFYEKGVLRGQAMLAQAIRRLADEGRLRADHPEEFADVLMGGVLGHQFFAILMGRIPVPPMPTLEARIERLLDTIRPLLQRQPGGDAEAGPAGRAKA